LNTKDLLSVCSLAIKELNIYLMSLDWQYLLNITQLGKIYVKHSMYGLERVPGIHNLDELMHICDDILYGSLNVAEKRAHLNKRTLKCVIGKSCEECCCDL
jgi:hypothetical protein